MLCIRITATVYYWQSANTAMIYRGKGGEEEKRGDIWNINKYETQN